MSASTPQTVFCFNFTHWKEALTPPPLLDYLKALSGTPPTAGQRAPAGRRLHSHMAAGDRVWPLKSPDSDPKQPSWDASGAQVESRLLAAFSVCIFQVLFPEMAEESSGWSISGHRACYYALPVFCPCMLNRR